MNYRLDQAFLISLKWLWFFLYTNEIDKGM